MLKKMKKLGKVVPLAMVLATLLLPFMAAATNSTTGDVDTNEGTVLAVGVFLYLVGCALIFWIMPQKKEKKLVPIMVAIGIAIAAMAILFYFTEWLTGYNITFWDEWIQYTGNEGAVLTSVAGSFLILLFTAYGAYIEKNEKKERNIITLGFIALLVWATLTLIPAFTFNI